MRKFKGREEDLRVKDDSKNSRLCEQRLYLHGIPEKETVSWQLTRPFMISFFLPGLPLIPTTLKALQFPACATSCLPLRVGLYLHYPHIPFLGLANLRLIFETSDVSASVPRLKRRMECQRLPKINNIVPAVKTILIPDKTAIDGLNNFIKTVEKSWL